MIFFFNGGREVERSMSIGTVLLLCLPSSPIIRFFSISGGVSVEISMHSRCKSRQKTHHRGQTPAGK